MIETAFVNIWGIPVGAVSWNEDRQLASFQYEPSFLERSYDLAPIQMPHRESTKIHYFPELVQRRDADLDTFKGLPGMLADSLPDKYGHQLIDAWLAQQGRAPKSMNPVEKLAFIGKRGMGALEYEPVQSPGQSTSYQLELESLVTISKKLLGQREDFSADLSLSEKEAVQDILRIGMSAGGARPKAVIAFNEKTSEVRSGQADAPKGFEHWLIKLDGVSDVQLGESQGYGRVEMAYYLMAKDAGIEMMESRLIEENDRAHFMTKRFDREGASTKHHMQTWCALRHFDFNNVHAFSYEQLFQTMRMLYLDYQEAEQMFRRMVFNVISRNCDDHTKNFAFIMKKDDRWRLAPAYDLCHAYRPDSIWVSQHALSINGKRKGHDFEDLMKVAKSMNIKKGKQIIEEIQDVVADWKKYADSVHVDPKKRDHIQATHYFVSSSK